MATSNNDRGSRIIKVGEGNELRKVEKDVLIPKIMKEKAMERCSEYVQGTDSNTCNVDMFVLIDIKIF